MSTAGPLISRSAPGPAPAVAARGGPPAIAVAAAATWAGLWAVVAASGVGSGSKTAVVLPLAAGLVLLLGGLAVSRFAAYTLLMLTLRSSVDLAKLSGSQSGTTESGSRMLDPSSLLGILFIFAAMLWLLSERQRGPLPGSRLRVALLGLLAAGALSVVGAAHPAPAALEVLRTASAVAMFVVLEQLAARPGGVRRVLAAVFASTLFPLGFTALSYLGSDPRVEEKNELARTVGSFNQSNEFGRYLMVILVMGVALYPHLRGALRAGMAAIVGSGCLFLLLTYTRSAAVGAVVGLIVVGLLQSRRLLAGLLIVGCATALFLPSVGERFSSLAEADAEGNSLTWRFSYWSELAPLAKESPLTGIGLAQTQYQTDEEKQPHNDFLRALLETGALGLAAYVGMFTTMVALAVRAVRRTVKGTLERGAAVGFLGAAAAFISVSAVSNAISNVAVLWYLMAFAAVGSALARRPAEATVPAAVPAAVPAP